MLRVLATRVLACSKRVEIPEKTSSGGKGGRNGKGKGKEIKALEPKKTRDLFDVLLEDTVLFPEGGGSHRIVAPSMVSVASEWRTSGVKPYIS